MQPLTYHIFFRERGQKGSALDSITPRAFDEAENDMGFASGAFVRALWDKLYNSALRTGWMLHPDTGRQLEFASLQFGGHTDKQQNGQGGILCQKWTHEEGLVKAYEPEPDLYGPNAVRERVPAHLESNAPEEIPEQPAPPQSNDVAEVTGLERYAPAPVSAPTPSSTPMPVEAEVKVPPVTEVPKPRTRATTRNGVRIKAAAASKRKEPIAE